MIRRPRIQRKEKVPSFWRLAVRTLFLWLILMSIKAESAFAATLYWDLNGIAVGGNPIGGTASSDFDRVTTTWNVNSDGTTWGLISASVVGELDCLLILIIGICFFWRLQGLGRRRSRQQTGCASRAYPTIVNDSRKQRDLLRLKSLCFTIAMALMVVPWSRLEESCQAAIITTGNVTPNPVTTTSNNTLYVGKTANGTMILDGGGLVQSYGGFIGYNPSVLGSVVVDGNNSAWTNNGQLRMGYNGTGTLTITHGGAVSDTTGFIGFYTGSTGSVTVNGAGSRWTNSDQVQVGVNGSGTLVIGGRGTVSNTVGFIALSAGSTGSVTVDGAGSTWTNSVEVRVGDKGSGALAITGGGAVSNTYGYIGTFAGATGSVNVDGAGSTWNNANNLLVGREGYGILSIAHDAVVNVAQDVSVDAFSLKSGSYIEFNGGTLNARNVVADHADLRGTGTINTQGWLLDQNLTIANSGDLPTQVLLNRRLGQNVTVNLNWTSQGIFGADNGTVAITGGYKLTSAAGYAANSSDASGTVTVNGAGSMWTSTGLIAVGRYGNGTLAVTGGGSVSDTDGYIGESAGSIGSATVNGASSNWTNTSTLSVGYKGHGTLAITGGGRTSNTEGYIGLKPLSTGGVTVDGAGSNWNNTSTLYVGYEGSGTLAITGGASVNNSSGNIGRKALATGSVTVDGAGSTWTNTSSLSVGRDGNGTLMITGGGTVSNSTTGFIGESAGSTGSVTVNGPGSRWTDNGQLQVGRDGIGTLVVSGGGAVSNSDGFIGVSAGSIGSVTVDGAGSSWTNNNYLAVGFRGHGMFAINNGGVVNALDVVVDNYGPQPGSYIQFSGGTLNARSVFADHANLRGTGTINTQGWLLDQNLTISNSGQLPTQVVLNQQPGQNIAVNLNWTSQGIFGADNGAVTINGGYNLTSSWGYIGYSANTIGSLTVDGAGSIWTNVSSLVVGREGNGTLVITGGATVSDSTGYIGTDLGSTGSVKVKGVGSTWTNSGTLYVGYQTHGTLAITEGGAVNVAGDVFVDVFDPSPDSYIEFNGGTLNTRNVIADHADLRGIGTVNCQGWVLDQNLTITNSGQLPTQVVLNQQPGQNITVNLNWTSQGIFGADNGTITIANGYNLNSVEGFIGYSLNSTGIVAVNGPGSKWTNATKLFVASQGHGLLAINGGGSVTNSDGIIGNSAGSMGAVTVNGPGSIWTNSGHLNVGDSGNGTLIVLAGGKVTNADGYIGKSAGSTGNVTVAGADSVWTNTSTLAVGYEGGGTLWITDDGSVSNTDGYIGQKALSTGNVTLDGFGMWTNSANLYVGYQGTGTLAINWASIVTNLNGYVGYDTGSTGSVTVNDGAWVNSENLSILNGTVHAINNGTVDVGKELSLGTGGTIDVVGSGADTPGSVSVGSPTAYPIRTVAIGTGGTLRGTGTIIGNVTNSNRVAPGNSPGIITINGDYTQTADGVLEIEVGGLTPGTQHDQVIVTGNATLGGSFEFPIINNFQPHLNDEITFFTTGGTISGAPKAIFAPNLASVDPNLGFVVIKDTQDLRLRFVSPSDVHFVDNSGLATQDWQQAAKWDVNRVPTTADKVDLSRSQAPSVQRVEVTSADAAAYELNVHDQSSPITIRVENGKTLAAAIGDVTIGQNAAIELGDGTSGNLGTLAAPTTKTVTLQDGGILKGNGSVSAGDLIVSKGTISPGFSVGHLDVTGNVQLTRNSTLIADVDSLHGAQHDTIDVTQNIELGGTLQLKVASTAVLQAGDTITLITAGGLTPNKVFQRVETIGSDDVFFAVNYPNVGVGGGSSVGTALELDVTTYERGDMNHDLEVNAADISYFAMALSDPNKYFNTLAPNGACICDFGQSGGDLGGPDGSSSDGMLTFDDISPFSSKLGMSQAELVAAMQNVPEPSVVMLLPVVAACLLFGRRCRVFAIHGYLELWRKRKPAPARFAGMIVYASAKG